MTTRRRALQRLASLAAGAASLRALAARPARRIGILSEASAEPGKATLNWEPDFWEAMAQRGWVVGRNVVVERAFASWRSDRLPALADELVKKRVDLIVSFGDQDAMVAAARATRTIPIVLFDAFDPVEEGLVESLARPGRNVTGISLVRGPEFALKRLEYLRAVAPDAKRLAWLWGHERTLAARVDGSGYDIADWLATAAKKMQFETVVYRVTTAAAIDGALADAKSRGVQALTANGFPIYLARRAVVDFALRERLPSAFAYGGFVEDGGLLSYAAADAEVDLLFRRWVEYVDRILRGAKPAEMPVIAADRYDLQINLRTAATLGLTIPPSILSRADALVR